MSGALRRLKQEFERLLRDPTEGIVAGPLNPDDFFVWECLLMGPPDTMYEYGVFRAILRFPQDYPLSPVGALRITTRGSPP